MIRNLIRFIPILLLLLGSTSLAAAREGDTLLPIEIDAAPVQTWPESLLNEDDARLIEGRVREARTAGVPLAVRIVDMSLPVEEMPFPLRQYVRQANGEPLSLEDQQAMVQALAESEPIETSEEANDGFMLLVLVGEDRTETQAAWWIGPNALPINGLTRENILATQSVMNQQFAEGNMPYGVFLGVSEFSYNIQFGEPERLVRSKLQNALRIATMPMALATAAVSLAIPVLAVVLSRKNRNTEGMDTTLTPWQAAALHQGRAGAEIPAAMLLESVHRGEITPVAGGGLRIEPSVSNDVVHLLKPYGDDEGVVAAEAVYEIESIMLPVRKDIEDSLAAAGAMTPGVKSDRTWMLVVMGLAGFLAVLSVVPSVVSMSAPGIFAIALAILCIGIGWWWLGYRRYTTPAGDELLAAWLETATARERWAFDLAVHQDLLTDQDGGPDTTNQRRLIRQLQGLGST